MVWLELVMRLVLVVRQKFFSFCSNNHQIALCPPDWLAMEAFVP
jgi:hypothetical protein